MQVTNQPKLIGILVAMICLSTLFGLERLSESGFLGLMGLIVGYLVGNGVAARNGDTVQPILSETTAHHDDRLA